MRIAENWKDYKIIDTSSGDKLESEIKVKNNVIS